MPGPIEGDVGIGDRRNMLYSSTVATYGRGRAVVVATGMQTEVGRIAGLLEAAEKEPTPLQQELDRTGKRLSVIMLGICAIVFATGLLSSPVTNLNAILSLFLFAVALAVAAIPEALPAIVTVGLSLGVRRMAAANAIVRKLPAVETLGAATVICSDKTGTLTRNEMTVRAIFTSGAEIEVGGSGYVPEGEFTRDGAPLAADLRGAVESTLRAAALTNDAALIHHEERWTVQGDPTEGALIVAARKFGLGEKELERFPRIAEIPFTSERKRHTTLHLDREKPAEAARVRERRARGPVGQEPSHLAGRKITAARRAGKGRTFAPQRRAGGKSLARPGRRHAHAARVRVGHRPGRRQKRGRDRHARYDRARSRAARSRRNDRSAAH
jgi:Ca2+-transporting ATPase